MTFSVGRVCKKVAGRESGKLCVVVSESDGHFVLIDGEVKRRNCNRNHLEPLNVKVDIKENADTKGVLSALQNAGFEVQGRKESTGKTVGTKHVKIRKVKEKKVEKKDEKKEKKEKKEEKKEKKEEKEEKIEEKK